jgi:uncharacterized damage-inducible protein DinB
MPTDTATVPLITSETLLHNWQEHRTLTRRTIEAFPEDKLFTFSVGGMRPFGDMAFEMISMAVPVVEGVSTGDWSRITYPKPTTKADLLRLWDEHTALLNEKFPNIPPAQFFALHKVFDQWEKPGIVTIQYAIDNEIHHRGQGYVYLRALKIEPPSFWERN